jgi:membrane-bound ClpP family serine protease
VNNQRWGFALIVSGFVVLAVGFLTDASIAVAVLGLVLVIGGSALRRRSMHPAEDEPFGPDEAP